MSRSSRRRASRILGLVLVVAAGSGVFAAVKKLARTGGAAAPLMALETVSSQQPLLMSETPAAPTSTPTPVAAPAAEPAKIEPETASVPTTPLPTTAPATTEPSLPLSGNALADARVRFEAGNLVAARKVLSDAIASSQLAAPEADAAKEMLGRINQQVVFSKRIFPEDPFTMTYTMQPGDQLRLVAANQGVTWEFLCRVNGISDPRRLRAFQTVKIVKGPFHAVISKRRFVMDLYLGSPGGASGVYVTSFPVGLGRDNSTPLGTWKVQGKLKNPTYFSPRGEGEIAADDPRNPLGEHWIGLTGVQGSAVGKMSYGIHGTIEPDSIGKEASMGCIRLRNDDVALVYEMLVENKSLVVVNE